MFITVKLLNGFQKILTYSVPPDWSSHALVGSLVHVPLQQRIERALICELHATIPPTPYAIKPAHALEQMPPDPHYHGFIVQLSHYYSIDPVAIYRRLHQPSEKKGTDDLAYVHEQDELARTIRLTEAQQRIVDALTPHLVRPRYYPALLHGVTGSGKTEIYKELMKTTYAQGKTTLLLLPEISLAHSFARILRISFGDAIPIYECHSATNSAMKRTLWKGLHNGEPSIIVGVHLPVLLPISNLGCIIIDEEHDPGFQEKRHPRINTKEAALLRAYRYQIPIVLGSATPSIPSLYNLTHRGWHLFTLHERFGGAFPTLRRVQLKMKKRAGADADSFWITSELRAAITDRLARKEQTIIFLNRRGMNRFVQCSGCAYLFSCTACSVSLTLHADQVLLCHYCGISRALPAACPDCKQPEETFIKKGVGTQRIVTILQTLFPHAVIDRADTDSTRDRKRWHETMRMMHQGSIDILVGTQTITKGYHFPGVTLVGIIWAESNLSFPFYTATETTLQQLLQVAGRAGRASERSEVIIQSSINHPLFSYLDETRYLAFYQYELEHRMTTGYPPCVRLSQIELCHGKEAAVARDAAAVVHILRTYALTHKLASTTLGPALPPVAKVQNRHLRTIYLKGATLEQHLALFRHVQEAYKGTSSLHFTPNPVR